MPSHLLGPELPEPAPNQNIETQGTRSSVWAQAFLGKCPTRKLWRKLWPESFPHIHREESLRDPNIEVGSE